MIPIVLRSLFAKPRAILCSQGPFRGVVTLGLLFCAVLATSLSAQTLDQLAAQIKTNGYINDFAGVLSEGAKNQLTALCTEVDQKAQAQIAVVTVKSIGDASIDQYAPDLFAKVGIGNKGTDRGVLILFAIDDHKYRTEVGYGLEPILPDGKVGDFGREAVPYLRQGNYDGAVELMTRRVADVIAADKGVALTGAPPAAPEPEGNGRLNLNGIFLFLFFGWFIFSVIRAMFRRGGPGNRINRGGGWWIGPMGGGWGGGGFGGGGGGGFGGFGGGGSGGGGASGGW